MLRVWLIARRLSFWLLMTIAIIVSLMRVVLFDIERYQASLQQTIQELSGLPIQIGQLSARVHGINPTLILNNVQLAASKSGDQPPIQLQQVRVALSMLDLLLTQNLLQASSVTLVGAKISIVRDAQGQLQVKGIPSSEGQPLWLLQGGRYQILRSEVSLQDLMGQQASVRFEGVNLQLSNHYLDGSHELHVVSRLPAIYGESLRISAHIKGDVFDREHLSGQLYIEAVDLQATALKADDLPMGFHLQSGSGDVRLWSDWQDGKPQRTTGYLQGQQIQIQRAQRTTVSLDTFTANFVWQQAQQGWRFWAYDVGFFTQHQRYKAGEVALQQTAQGDWGLWVPDLDFAALMTVAPLVSTQDGEWVRWLALKPSGSITEVKGFSRGDFQQYALIGHLQNWGNAPYQGIPGWQNINADVSMNERYGQLNLHSENALFDASDLFRQPLQVNRLQGLLHWWQMDDAWRLQANNLQLDTVDFESVNDLNLQLAKNGAAPLMDLRTHFGNFDTVQHAPRYFPAKIMDADALAWLDAAFIGGHVPNGELIISGSLDKMPFDDGSGVFEVLFNVENGELQFNEDWPHLKQMLASVQFYGPDLKVSILEAQSEKVVVEQALVTIKNLADADGLQVNGVVHSALSEGLNYLNKTPLKDRTQPISELLTLQGQTQVNLDLDIPFELKNPVKAKVSAELNDANLTVNSIALPVSDISGQLFFTESSVSSSPLQGKVLGNPLKAQLRSNKEATLLSAESQTSLQQLQKQFAFLKTDLAKGQLPYQVQLTLPNAAKEASSLDIRSSLKGLSIETGDVLAKTADQETPLSLHFQFEAGELLPLTLQYGSQLQARLHIDKKQQKWTAAHIVYGNGQLGMVPQSGIDLDIRLPSFDIGRALAVTKDPTSVSSWPAIKFLRIDTEQMQLNGQNLGALHLAVEHREQGWQGRVDTAAAHGYLRIPDERTGAQRIRLEMDSLNLTALNKFKLEGSADAVQELPLIDIDSQQLLWGDLNLGHLRVQTERIPAGIHFKRLELSDNNYTIQLSADWLKTATSTATQMNGKLDVKDFGRFLQRLGLTEDVKETVAHIDLVGGWPGGPQAFSLASFTGQLKVDLQDGRISSIEPGFGRLLGLIAMEQWVKRLSLDFTDVYRQGLVFDEINGSIQVERGLATTNDLSVDAAAAKFAIVGTTNLVQKTTDLRVAVIPRSSAALPIAGTIVSGIAGVITQVVADDYREGYFFGSQYQLIGPFGNIEVKRLPEQDGLFNKTWRGLTDFSWLGSDSH